MKRLNEIFENAIRNGTFPGAVLLVGNSSDVLFKKAYGYRSLKPEREKNDVSTIYDVASMTKVVATTSAIMRLVEMGKIRLYDPVNRFVKEFEATSKDNVRIWHLLTHTSGLPPYSDAWRYANGRGELLSYINNTSLVSEVGKKFVYSCLNFIILMEIIERVTSEKLDVFAKREIFDPIGMNHTGFNPPKDWMAKIAPTSERDGNLLRGKVDDELAYYLGGTSGNAGLFSNAEDLYKFAKVFMNKGNLNGKRIFSQATVNAFSKEAFSDSEVRRTLGWNMKSTACSCGDLMSDAAYGHTGFTGTSIWIDPIYDVVVILLTNRVHVSRRGNQEEIIRFRPLIHNYIVAHKENIFGS